MIKNLFAIGFYLLVNGFYLLANEFKLFTNKFHIKKNPISKPVYKEETFRDGIILCKEEKSTPLKKLLAKLPISCFQDVIYEQQHQLATFRFHEELSIQHPNLHGSQV